MTLTELAAQAEAAIDQLATALNQQRRPADMGQVAKHLRGVVHGVTLALAPLSQDIDADVAEQAGESIDALLTAMPALAVLVDAAQEVDYRDALAVA